MDRLMRVGVDGIAVDSETGDASSCFVNRPMTRIDASKPALSSAHASAIEMALPVRSKSITTMPIEGRGDTEAEREDEVDVASTSEQKNGDSASCFCCIKNA